MRFIRTPIICVIYFLLVCIRSVGQQPQLNESLIAPTPDVVAFVKNGLTPVTLYTGLPNVSIPIIDLKSTKLHLPIVLSYNYNGYQPNQDASWIGMGWNVEAGGVITRIVKGLYDEKANNVTSHWDDYANVGDLINNSEFMQFAGNGQADTEPDLYMFNFNGRSGKFILIGDNAFLFPYQDIIIKRVGTYFKITTEDGTTYTFGTYGAQETTTVPETDISYISAWYLSKIESADLTDVIDFAYAPFATRPGLNSLSETYSVSFKVVNGCDLTAGGQGWSAQWNLGGTVGAKRLIKITSKNAIIDFIPESTPRLDVGGAQYQNAYALKEIDFSNKSGVLLKKAIFNHTYFPGNTQLKLSSLLIQGSYNQLSASENYSFSYQSETASFPKGTRGIDKWGFYNGNDGNAMLFDETLGLNSYSYPLGDRTVNPTYCAQGILNKITYPTGGYTTFAYENNRIDPAGATQYVHETRTAGDIVFYSGINPYRSVSSTFTINEEQDVYIDYSRDISNYPNGFLNTYNILTICKQNDQSACYNSPKVNKSESGNSAIVHLTPGTYTYTITCDQGVISSTAHIRYYWVNTSQIVYIPGPGMRIKTIKAYDNVSNSVPTMTKNYTYADATLLNSNDFGFNIIHHTETNTCVQENQTSCSLEGYNEFLYTSDYGNPLLTLVNDQFFYPQVTEINNSQNGSGKTEYYFNAGGSLEALSVYLSKQNDYSYKNNQYILLKSSLTNTTLINPINFTAFTCQLSEIASATGAGGCKMGGVDNPNLLDTIWRDRIYSAKIYNLVSAYNRTVYTKDIMYDQDGLNPITTETDYFYDNPKFIAPTKCVTTNSKAQTITTLFKYPIDYGGSNCNTMHDIIQTFKTARDGVSGDYQTCVQTRMVNATPYCPGYTFISVGGIAPLDCRTALRQYQCEQTYKTASASVKSALASNWVSVYNLCNGGSAAVAARRNKNIIDDPAEEISFVTKNNTDYFLSALKTDYTSNGIYPKLLYSTKHAASDISLSAFNTSPNNYYDGKVNFVYDANNNLISQYKTNDVKLDYIWDYNNALPIAQVTWNKPASGDYSNYYAYTSFESDGKGKWSFLGPPILATSPTGKYCYRLDNYDITISDLDPSQTYWLTYWTQNTSSYTINTTIGTKGKKVDGWTYFEHQIQPAGGVITIHGTGNIDELRLYPKDAQMTTYTYEPLIGMTTQCDVNNKITYYDYDGLGRLRLIKDQDKNVVKKICYNYAGEPMNCDASIFYNAEKSGTYYKNDCSPGYYGSAVTYTVLAGKYSSTVSQSAANSLATSDKSANGPNYANSVGTCNQIVQVTPSCSNLASVSGFTAVFTSLTTNITYTYNIASNGVLTAQGSTPATLPSGYYDLNISKANNNSIYVFKINCNLLIAGKSATFSNVEVQQWFCSVITIDLNN